MMTRTTGGDKDLLEVLKYVDLFFPNDREAKKIAHTAGPCRKP